MNKLFYIFIAMVFVLQIEIVMLLHLNHLNLRAWGEQVKFDTNVTTVLFNLK